MRWMGLGMLLMVGTTRQDEIKKIIPDAEKVKKVVRKIGPESRRKIESALGQALEEKDLTVTLYEAFAPVEAVSPTEKIKVSIVTVSTRGPKGLVRIGVAASLEDKVLGVVKILENGDDKAIESPAFMIQFDGFFYTADLYNPPTVLAELFRSAEQDRELTVLVKQSGWMHRIGAHWDALTEKLEAKDRGSLEHVKESERLFAEVARQAPSISFLKDSQKDRFKGTAEAVVRYLKGVGQKISDGDYDEALRELYQAQSTTCGKCHGSFSRVFREERAKKKLGNGYFILDHDVHAPLAAPPETAQAVATAVKKALLLMSEAK